MKILIILLSILNISAAHAKESILFSHIPSSYITTEQAIEAVTAAALKRKWSVHGLENNKTRIELNHRGYKAILEFSFSENEIRYSDFTTYFDEMDDDGSGEWKKGSVPGNWLYNLRSDVNTIFITMPKRKTSVKESFSHEIVVKKLESLKTLYDKKMITESEYKLKKKEIMSAY